MAKLSFDSKTEADQYAMLRDKNKSGGFDTEEEANLYSSLRKKATANTETSYWGDVLKNAKKEWQTPNPMIDMLTLGGSALVQGRNPLTAVAEAPMGMVNQIKEMPNQLNTVRKAAMGALPVMGKVLGMKQTSEQAANEAPYEQAFNDVTKPILHPIDSFRESPLGTLAVDVPLILGALTGVKGMTSKTPKITPKTIEPLTPSEANAKLALEKPGLYDSLRRPVKVADIGVKEYYNGVKHIYNTYEKSASAVEGKYPDKLVTVIDLQPALKVLADEDAVLASRIKSNPKLSQVVNGETNALSLRDLRDIKNKLTGKIGAGKMKSGGTSLDVQSMELVNEINKSIINNFPEMSGINARFGTDITNSKILKPFGNIKSATDAAQSLVGNQAARVAAQQFFSPEYYNLLRKSRVVGNIGLPIKGTTWKIGNLLEKTKFSEKELAQMRDAEIARRTVKPTIKGMLDNITKGK